MWCQRFVSIWNICSVVFLKGQPQPLFHLFSSFHCTVQTISSHQDSNLDRQSRRWERWPLYHHHGPSLAVIYFYSHTLPYAFSPSRSLSHTHIHAGTPIHTHSYSNTLSNAFSLFFVVSLKLQSNNSDDCNCNDQLFRQRRSFQKMDGLEKNAPVQIYLQIKRPLNNKSWIANARNKSSIQILNSGLAPALWPVLHRDY